MITTYFIIGFLLAVPFARLCYSDEKQTGTALAVFATTPFVWPMWAFFILVIRAKPNLLTRMLFRGLDGPK